MSIKPRRQREILRLIGTGSIRTQDQLSSALAALGIQVSQGTLSRDLRELGVARAPDGYSVPDRRESVAPARNGLARVASQFMLDIRTAQNLVVLRTAPGGANALAQHLDAAAWPEIVGTIAGDDTIFVAMTDSRTAERVRQRLAAL